MKKTAMIAIATQALEEKGLGHKRAKECAEHILEALDSVGAVKLDPAPPDSKLASATVDNREYDAKKATP